MTSTVKERELPEGMELIPSTDGYGCPIHLIMEDGGHVGYGGDRRDSIEVAWSIVENNCQKAPYPDVPF